MIMPKSACKMSCLSEFIVLLSNSGMMWMIKLQER